MEDKAKSEIDRQERLSSELQNRAKDDPKRAVKLEAMKRVMEENREVLQRLADA